MNSLLLLAGIFASMSSFHGCALAPDNLTGYVVTLDTIAVLKTLNGGSTWSPIPTSASRKFFDVFTLDGEKVWTCGILGEIMYSADGGNTWSMQVTGVSKYLTRIEFYDSLYGWAVGGDGIVARTRNGGDYWYQYFTPFYLAEFYGVSFVDTLTGYAVAGWPDNYETAQGYIVRSVNGGINWELLCQSEGYDEYLDVYAINENVIVVVGGNDETLEPIILRSSDGGNTWDSLTNIPSGAYYLRAVDFVGNKGWAVGRSGTILHTEDGGQTWVRQFSPADSTLFDVDFSDEFHGIACGYNHIIYTTDGGQTWNDGVISSIGESRKSIPTISFSKRIFTDLLAIEISNPSNGDSRMDIMIFDAKGTLVMAWHSLPMDGVRRIVWDGKGKQGKPAESGVYYIKVEFPGGFLLDKVIKVR